MLLHVFNHEEAINQVNLRSVPSFHHQYSSESPSFPLQVSVIVHCPFDDSFHMGSCLEGNKHFHHIQKVNPDLLLSPHNVLVYEETASHLHLIVL